MSRQRSSNTTDKSGMMTPPTAPKRMSSTQSLNHLLNFTLPPRQSHQSAPRRTRRTNESSQAWNKERFVNAQYRFVMNPTGDYTVHFADPDIFFQWHDILQVIIPRTSAMAAASSKGESVSQEEGFTTCPICLAPPTAPRVTKCGHLFCFPCILHLLETAETKWARCPVCFDSVSEKHLKAVKWLDDLSVIGEKEKDAESSSSTSAREPDTFRPGSTLLMRLMQRPQITTLALPRSATWPSDLMPPHQAPFHFLPDVFEFAKFMLATPDQLVADLSQDLEEVAAERRTLLSLKDEIALIFVDIAEEKLRHQLAKAAALDSEHLKDAIEKVVTTRQKLEQDRLRRTTHQRTDNALDDQEEAPNAFLSSRSEYHGPSHGQARNPRQRRNVNPPPPSTQTYYYYQAASGLPIFLHPLDIRILLSHFSSYPAFPDNITVRVEAHSEGTVNDDLRKRWKYLAHLPEGTDVVFIEADLEGVIGTEGLASFEGALKQRRARRKEKGKREDKAKAKAEEKEKEKLAETFRHDALTSRAYFEPPVSLADFPSGPEESTTPSTPVNAPTPSGAWGNRSFASLLQSPTTSNPRPRQQESSRANELDEYDDVAWHELERMSNLGGRRRGKKMIVLGGNGGRRR
ncbi:hypothetical protein BJ322DRAFT_1051407 [Thelephora terrestris]|uniref:RING-type domain-containing protein n=1 Tax=Thelephora terrestris TaxID=56493 RepID=A0A9P6L7G4_9AGAM|nr:hypothetical protein BJ322DRAFT_1051407 [Thelephora terrestris]